MARKKTKKTPAKTRSYSRPMKRRTRRKGLSQAGSLPIIGKIGLENPIIGGMVGAFAGMFLKNQIPDNLFDKNGEESALKPYVKGLALVGAGLIAKNYGYGAIAGGMFATATVLTLQKLNVPGLAENSVKYADPSIFMNETALLSQDNSIYPDYMPLYETELLSNQY